MVGSSWELSGKMVVGIATKQALFKKKKKEDWSGHLETETRESQLSIPKSH